jgi:putative ATPase
LGYGSGYKYDHAEQDGVAPQTYLPDRLAGETFYTPSRFGFEKTVAERLKWWAERRVEPGGEDEGAG